MNEKTSMTGKYFWTRISRNLGFDSIEVNPLSHVQLSYEMHTIYDVSFVSKDKREQHKISYIMKSSAFDDYTIPFLVAERYPHQFENEDEMFEETFKLLLEFIKNNITEDRILHRSGDLVYEDCCMMKTFARNVTCPEDILIQSDLNYHV